MKHTKKLVSVPENEYNAMLGMLLDPMKKEKVLTDQKIADTLSARKMSQLERGVHYQALTRKRRMLNKKIDDKPLRVLMEQGNAAVHLPTAGIAPVGAQQVQEIQQQPVEEPAAEQEEEPVVEEEEEVPIRGTYDKYQGKIAARFTNRLYRYVNQSRAALGITDEGKIITSKRENVPEPDSDFNNVLDFLLGYADRLAHRKSGDALMRRLVRNDEIKDLIHQSALQGGRGRRRRRYVVQVKPIKSAKTKGLTRFKPIIWSKIPV